MGLLSIFYLNKAKPKYNYVIRIKNHLEKDVLLWSFFIGETSEKDHTIQLFKALEQVLISKYFETKNCPHFSKYC